MSTRLKFDKIECIAESSNGRTTDFGSVYFGSNPSSAAKDKMKFGIISILLVIGAVFLLLQQEPVQNPNLVSSSMPISSPTNNMITELKIEDLKIGTGAEVKSGDTILINYKGTLLNGTQFDSSYDRGQPFETKIGVGMVIEGWDVGVIGMKVGGKRKLTIPSNMAYGPQGAGGIIPPNSPLIFELELLSIK